MLQDVKVGHEVPRFERHSGFETWNRYAAVNDEFVPIHMDDAAGRAAGYPGAFGMGNLQWAYLHNMLRDWLDGEGVIRSLSCQFRNPNLQGQVVSACGVVETVTPTGDGTAVTLRVWTEDQDGTVLAPGSAEVWIPQS
ncbi:MaoC/PaaZ C-terminal domain-containing protein [Nocardioides houyundeii]|uniref:MaoC/PaaZ C-terminal domain-containing protein n=1 Tax=Nocardioides houyundeii TaxID=2045452 RepID=UPI000C77EEFA|nr:MaoC/PaaZ C-terminal domain-containing protein [Nocardioides houyundeii]